MNSNKYFTFNSLFNTNEDDTVDNPYYNNESNSDVIDRNNTDKGIVDYLLYASIVVFFILLIACLMLIGYIK